MMIFDFESYAPEDTYVHHSDDDCPNNFPEKQALLIKDIIRHDDNFLESFKVAIE